MRISIYFAIPGQSSDSSRTCLAAYPVKKMPLTLVSPMNDAAAVKGVAAPRLNALEGKTIALLDISKPGGSIFLDRVEHLLRSRYKVGSIIRDQKPTYTK